MVNNDGYWQYFIKNETGIDIMFEIEEDNSNLQY